MTVFKHILVPTDLSDASGDALNTAIELAVTFGARLTLLHVWTMPTMGYAEGLAWPVDEMKQAAKRSLDELRAKVAEQVPATDAVVKSGLDWQRIVEAASDGDVDLIVMGTHGRHGLPRVLLGSVAERVVRMAPVPVLTVRGRPSETK